MLWTPCMTSHGLCNVANGDMRVFSRADTGHGRQPDVTLMNTSGNTPRLIVPARADFEQQQEYKQGTLVGLRYEQLPLQRSFWAWSFVLRAHTCRTICI